MRTGLDELPVGVDEESAQEIDELLQDRGHVLPALHLVEDRVEAVHERHIVGIAARRGCEARARRRRRCGAIIGYFPPR